MTRVFVAVEMPADLSPFFQEMQKRLSASGKLTLPKSFHCTLKFIGEVSDDEIGEISKKLSEITFSPMKLRTTHCGAFPANHNPRVIWMGLSGQLDALASEVEAKLGAKYPADKPFRAHVTLGRVKYIQNKKELKDALAQKIDEKEFIADEFKLVKSVLTPNGPEYTDLAVFKAVDIGKRE